MIRVFLAFVVVFSLFFFGIKGFRTLTGQEQWELTKLLTYSAFCAILAFVFLITLVVLF
jgi:succinate dehydrogenase/fumarate reductase cytochrome b subunit